MRLNFWMPVVACMSAVGVAAIEAYAREHHDTVDEDGDISGV